MILQECQPLVDPVVEDVHAILNEWVDVFLQYHSIFVAPAQIETTSTRFNQLVDLARGVAGVINSKKAFVTMADSTNSIYFSYNGGTLSGDPVLVQTA